MIENIRKYTGLMIVVFVVLFVSFLLLDTSSVQNIGGGGSVLRVDGRTFSDKEYRRIGHNGFELTQELMRAGNFELYQFLIASTIDAADESDGVEKFFITRILLRSAAEEFGLQPSDAEISGYIRSLQAFAGPDGDFDTQTYSTFVERRIGRLGMTESDIRDLVRDILVYEKLSDVVGSGLAPIRDAVERNDAFENQRISGALAHLELAPFEQAVEPTEEEVREFWENLQDAFTTEPRRQFTYVYVNPDLPEDLTEEEEDLPEFTFGDLALSEEERAARDAEFQAERAAERAEKRRELQRETDQIVERFFDELIISEGASFEELAGEMGLEVKHTELFPESDPPADLAVALRQSSRGGNAVDELFRMVTSPDPFSKISPPLAVDDGGWIVARLDEIEPSRTKTYEEAAEEARELFIEEKAVESMFDAAEAAIAQINEALADGMSFAEAAEAAGLDDVHTFEEITNMHTPDPANEPQNLYEASRTVGPGTVADVITESDRAFILYVAQRELVRDVEIEPRIDMQLAQAARANESTAFVAWLRTRTQAAAVQQLYRR